MSKINLLLFVEFILIFGVNACQQESQNWNSLSSTRGYPELVYDYNSDSLWIFDETKNTVGYIDNNGNGNNSVIQNIPYPSTLDLQNTILDFCASEDIWVVTDNGKLLLYDTQDRIWVENLSVNDRVRSCEPLNSKAIAIVAGKNKVGIVNREDVDWLPDPPGTVKNLYQDDFGNIWVVSYNSSEDKYIIYKQEGKDGWSEQFRDLGGRLLLVKNNSIWTAGGLVTVFESSIENDIDVSGTPLTQIQIDGLLLDLFSDKNHNIWLVTNKNVMLRTPGKNDFSVVSLPANVDRIIDSTFDIKNCLLYISTDIGILYNTNNCKAQ